MQPGHGDRDLTTLLFRDEEWSAPRRQERRRFADAVCADRGEGVRGRRRGAADAVQLLAAVDGEGETQRRGKGEEAGFIPLLGNGGDSPDGQKCQPDVAQNSFDCLRDLVLTGVAVATEAEDKAPRAQEKELLLLF